MLSNFDLLFPVFAAWMAKDLRTAFRHSGVRIGGIRDQVFVVSHRSDQGEEIAISASGHGGSACEPAISVPGIFTPFCMGSDS